MWGRGERDVTAHHLYVTTANGMHNQPSSEHLVSLVTCFHCSETWADGEPAVAHTSLRAIGLSHGVMVR